ncbi:hypothetical protein T10_27 [Trichinella papuae]|uniref:Uncharacterized protein n=1 Tax=Trichinella papuae TaxID=268474 RepID=A0A0V1MN27_9BILA|nr:hypothetical protein T10_27 [Trichinella papuae]
MECDQQVEKAPSTGISTVVPLSTSHPSKALDIYGCAPLDAVRRLEFCLLEASTKPSLQLDQRERC